MDKAIANNPDKLDEEWVELILIALNAGIHPQEIKDFFREKNT
jgi:hypothetical protein